jgi:hypothetical protein
MEEQAANVDFEFSLTRNAILFILAQSFFILKFTHRPIMMDEFVP